MSLQIDTTRLIKLLGMLGSDFDAERAAAGLAAHRLLREAKLTWSDVLRPALPPPPPDNPPRQSRRSAFDMASFALDFRDTLLSGWEIEFCRSVGTQAARGGRLSEKQMRVLSRIVSKCERSARAA